MACPICGSEKFYYSFNGHFWECNVCEHKEFLDPKPNKCFNCGRSYLAFTWFDPSGCPYCHSSFVD